MYLMLGTAIVSDNTVAARLANHAARHLFVSCGYAQLLGFLATGCQDLFVVPLHLVSATGRLVEVFQHLCTDAASTVPTTSR